MRIHKPITTSTADNTNGIRQPYERKASDSSPRVMVVIKNVTDDRTEAMDGTSIGNEENQPSRLGGAYSAAIKAAPAHSPPTAKPCRNRIATRSAGASQPKVPSISGVGNRPMATVAAPIMISVATSALFRPSRSP